ncbi:RNA-metabolising metallo-beta-lactamase [Oleidesulfovibrio alaskensis G20]|jgi:metallo-beta-lactamase family protein|uniref:RNA-metabolising metallo-beta-lactamase n=1 Tax=Oleidesulfovibrio alaskensis (strain ATCC BAA-1058 / DSM 17464 / G20) TaxID=207559 RepID=Q310R8_OLEA2|nr:MBL fold metallo-hydrolase [Oleidesulfovibrio alaskensis]ABB38578.1 RNA-metabolising metallo-beta-lactamase [Oleidesulfovibrio alaskensis G20]MBG0773936.1 MBL fold metallo-hydrolase [Oleidesulfovibrio alaskensis]MBL3581594.1 MBL fold metallo-hydrolase [Oleidesulfovibrio alaskensis]MBL3588073.1 MBL fold metallo-hydrolase [bacterium]
MKVQFLGAARTVTGSCYVVESGGVRFAVDCGMHQGNHEIEKRNYETDVYSPETIDFFLITHAHIDHTGLLPRMVRDGFTGPVYCTEPTRDLLEIMLQDSANIQEMEAEWQTRKQKRKGRKPVDPLYTFADAARVSRFFENVEYNRPFSPVEGVTVTYKDAGHILGSAFLEIEVCEHGRCSRLIFSGDLGKPNSLIVRDPEAAAAADYLFVESTYGDRNHKDESNSRQELAEAIAYSYRQGEKVIIPAFAVERTQEVLYTLFLLQKEGRMPVDMPIFLDSPLAIRATEIFRKHPRFFDEEMQKLLLSGEDPFAMPSLRLTTKTQESQAINNYTGPAVIISASGMCNAGRIKHHLRHNIWRPGASIVFVGYQAVGTPGRRIVDGARSIRLFGEEIAIQAKVFTIGGFSGHAGQSQILDWVGKFATKEMKVFLVHGEEKAQQALKAILEEKYELSVHSPGYLEEIELEPGEAVVTTGDPQRYQPQLNWDFLLSETEARMMQLRARKGDIEHADWAQQVEIRDRLLELNNEMLGILSEL